MEADAGFAEAAPEDADGVVGAAGDVKVGIGAFSGIEELLIIAPNGEFDGGFHFPLAVADELRFSGCDGEGGDERLIADGGRVFRIGDDEGAKVCLVDADLV